MSLEQHARDFEAARPRLAALAYHAVGSIGDAEDLVQDAWLRLAETREPVRNVPAFLTTVVSRLCIDHLRSARHRRLSYVGPWLPEPVVYALDVEDSPETAAALGESLSMAFLVMLEALSPVERLVLVLREVFDVDYVELAEIVERSEAAVRQIAKRARDRAAAGPPRFKVDPAAHKALVTRFALAVASGDTTALTALLATNATMTSDGGGAVTAARKPVVGAKKLVNFFIKTARKNRDAQPRFVQVNGRLGVALYVGDRAVTVIAVETDGSTIHSLYMVRNPAKLARVPTLG